MKTIIAVTFFGVLTYAFADTLSYGGDSCQQVTGMKDTDTAKVFSGTWYLTHSTASTGVTEPTICREYKPMLYNNGTIKVTSTYIENGWNGISYDTYCFGNQDETGSEKFIFDCTKHNRYTGESNKFHVDMFLLATDYDKFGVVYRCVTSDTQFEDNVFILHRKKKSDNEELKKYIESYGLRLDQFISRRTAFCTRNEKRKGEKPKIVMIAS